MWIKQIIYLQMMDGPWRNIRYWIISRDDTFTTALWYFTILFSHFNTHSLSTKFSKSSKLFSIGFQLDLSSLFLCAKIQTLCLDDSCLISYLQHLTQKTEWVIELVIYQPFTANHNVRKINFKEFSYDLRPCHVEAPILEVKQGRV